MPQSAQSGRLDSFLALRHRLILSVLIVAVALLARWGSGVWHWNFEDLEVYRKAAGLLRHGCSLYSPTSGLPFTYPPFAAVVFVPLQASGSVLARASLTVLSLASLAILMRTSTRQLRLPNALLLPLCLAALTMEPVLRTLRLGQVNLVLAALVVIDCFLLPRRYRGVMVGLAAGIKIVPGVFLLYFLLRRDWAAVLRAGGAFALSVAVSALFVPHDTVRFWTKLFYDPDHIGGIAYVDNQSLTGVLVRVTHREHPPSWQSVLLELAALILAVFAARRQLSEGRELAALTCIGIGGLLASPISWSHHWIWLLPAILVCLVDRRRVLAASLIAVGYLAPQWFTPYGGLREFHQNPAQVLLCNLMCVVGMAFLIAMARERNRKDSAVLEPGDDEQVSARRIGG